MLPINTFKTVVESTPLVSIDLIVRNSNNQILLGKRVNRPAQNNWFVPGGRILKDESFDTAFERLIKVELSLQNTDANFLGVYQHFYEDNFSEGEFTTHYVVLAYEIKFDGDLSSLPDEQHNDYLWFEESELLSDDKVHKHSKWYFQNNKQADSKLKYK